MVRRVTAALAACCVMVSAAGFAAQNPAAEVCIGSACVRAEIADTPAAREQGLMHRASLAADAGMLFIHDREAVLPFWMKNTLIPLDMIWISGDRRVVHIVENAQPCEASCERIVPPVKARYVLEVNAGFVRAHAIARGDEAVF